MHVQLANSHVTSRTAPSFPIKSEERRPQHDCNIQNVKSSFPARMPLIRPRNPNFTIHLTFYLLCTSLDISDPFIKCQNRMWKFIGKFAVFLVRCKKREKKRVFPQIREKDWIQKRNEKRKFHEKPRIRHAMPTSAEVRERMDQLAGRARVLGSHSMQQVQRFGSRSVSYVRQKINVFNEIVRGRKSDQTDPQNSSTSSDKNRDSSKDCFGFWEAHVERRLGTSLETVVWTCFLHLFTWLTRFESD